MRSDDVVVEHGLIHRDRKRFVRTERDRVAKLLRVVDPVDVENADTDAVGADAKPHILARQVVLREELIERFCERRDVAYLAADDHA